MNDRELIEMSAKAIGLEVKWDELNYPWIGEFEIFDPLKDDGDAFRLAVKLAMFNGAKMFHYRSLERFNNPDASELEWTRRAIVLTAAEIGKSMP